MKTFVRRLLIVLGGLAVFASPALAHVVVNPKEAGVASFQTFSVGVPSETDKSTTPTTYVRLVLPSGLSEVTPTVKSGWTIDVKKDSNDNATEITWSGGKIPSEQRDDFTFSAQVPADATTLIWKAYQTYQDGTVVAWDADPKNIPSGQEGTPYSTTDVINDLANTNTSTTPAKASDSTAKTLSIIALSLSIVAVGVASRKRKA